MKSTFFVLNARISKVLFLPILGFLILSANVKTFGENKLQINPVQVKTVTDTLFAVNDLVFNPFGADYINLYFDKKMKTSTKTLVTLVPNKHDSTVVDTLKTIYWGESYIETISNAFIDGYLVSIVSIKNNMITLKNNIRIGQSIDEVCKTFDVKYDSAKTYQYLELQCPNTDGFEVPLYLFFVFENNKLSEIVYMNGFD
jgi:hypothetical protein